MQLVSGAAGTASAGLYLCSGRRVRMVLSLRYLTFPRGPWPPCNELQQRRPSWPLSGRSTRWPTSTWSMSNGSASRPGRRPCPRHQAQSVVPILARRLPARTSLSHRSSRLLRTSEWKPREFQTSASGPMLAHHPSCMQIDILVSSSDPSTCWRLTLATVRPRTL